MPYAVEMYFNSESDNQIRSIWKVLHDKNISSYMYTSGSRPHVTLSVLNFLNVSEFSKRLEEFSCRLKPFKISFGSIGIFPEPVGVIFLAPTVTEELLRIHREFNDVFSDYRDQMWNYYLPGSWVPHCTLATDLLKKDIPLAMECILDNYQSLNAWVEEIGIVEFRPIKYHTVFKLQQKGTVEAEK